MPEILTLLSCLTFDLNSTSLKHLGCIIQAMLAMSGRVTMLGISRWAGLAHSLAPALKDTPSDNGGAGSLVKEAVIEPFNDFSTALRTGRR